MPPAPPLAQLRHPGIELRRRPLPRVTTGVLLKPAHHPGTRVDRRERQVSTQLLSPPAIQHRLERPSLRRLLSPPHHLQVSDPSRPLHTPLPSHPTINSSIKRKH